jgi:hypothetical protein
LSDSELEDSPVGSLNSLDSYEKIVLFNRTSIKEPSLIPANPIRLINDTLQQLEAILSLPASQSDKDSLYDLEAPDLQPAVFMLTQSQQEFINQPNPSINIVVGSEPDLPLAPLVKCEFKGPEIPKITLEPFVQ